MQSTLTRAYLPWASPDAEVTMPPNLTNDSQFCIEQCLYHCPFADTECVDCLAGGKSGTGGRPPKVDTSMLREMLKLRVANKEACRQLGISLATLTRYKQKIREELAG